MANTTDCQSRLPPIQPLLKRGWTLVFEQQYINQYLHQRSVYHKAGGTYSTLKHNTAPVSDRRVPNSPYLINTFTLFKTLSANLRPFGET